MVLWYGGNGNRREIEFGLGLFIKLWIVYVLYLNYEERCLRFLVWGMIFCIWILNDCFCRRVRGINKTGMFEIKFL